MAISITTAARNAACNAVVDLCDAGTGTAAATLKIYTTGLGTLLSSHLMTNPAFGDAAIGVATAAAIADDTDADNTGTAAEFVIVDRDDTQVLAGSVSAAGGGGDMILDSVSIVAGTTVSITAGTITMPA